MSNEWQNAHLWRSGGGIEIISTLEAPCSTNTTADVFDIEYLYYAGPLFSSITVLNDYVPVPGQPPISVHVHGDPDSPNPIITTYRFTPGADTVSGYGADNLTWTNVTDKVYFRGSFTSEWNDSSIVWRASIRGQDYSDAYFGPGRAILCLRRIYNGSWQPWETAWLGQITKGSYTDDYQAGELWTREIGGLNASLSKTNAPRVVLGRLNIATADQASVQASSTLMTPAVEVDNYEFVGSVANVDPDNVIDENINTVWISQDQPDATGETLDTTGGDNKLRIDEVFFMPVSGWSADSTWWFELVNTRAEGGADIDLVLTLQGGIINRAGVKLCFKYTTDGDEIPTGQYVLGPGERGIICADKRVFESYTGGAASARWIIEAKSWNTGTGACNTTLTHERFRLSNIAGSIQLYNYLGIPTDTVAWNRTGNTPLFHQKTLTASYTAGATTMQLDNLTNWSQLAVSGQMARITDDANSDDFTYNDVNNTTLQGVSGVTHNYAAGAQVFTYGSTMGWDDAAINLNTINGGGPLASGQSIRRSPPGTDSDTAAEWIVDSFPTPASDHAPDSYEWIMIDLDTISSELAQDTQPGDTTITLTDTTGWFDPGGASLQGIIYNQGDTFSYSGKTATTLTGVSGIEGVYFKGEPVYPYEPANPNGRKTQIGWPLSRIVVSRLPAPRSAIEKMRIYLSSVETPLTPDDDTWSIVKTDWDDAALMFDQTQHGKDGHPLVHTITWNIESEETPPRRARHILVIIDQMSDYGRAKINSIEAFLSQSAVNDSGIGDIDDTRAGELARYILVNYQGLYANDIAVNTAGGEIGTFAIAIAPYTTVLNDLARNTGALVRYGLYQAPTNDTTVAINWEPDPWWPDTNNNLVEPLYTFSSNSIRGTVELSDSQIDFDAVAVNATNPDRTQVYRQVYPPASSSDVVRELTDYIVSDETTAWLLAQMIFRRESSTQTVTLTVKGVGEWCAAGQWVALTWDLDGDGTAETTNWVIEHVTQSWDWTTTGKSFQTQLGMRRYWR